MARLNFTAGTQGVDVALAAATAKTVLQITAPANQRVALKGFTIAFDGVTAGNEPVLVELVDQSAASPTGTFTSVTMVPSNTLSAAETVQTTGGHTATVEPTPDGSTVKHYLVHPQSGVERVFGPDEEIILGGGDILGMVVTAPDIVNCIPEFSCEE